MGFAEIPGFSLTPAPLLRFQCSLVPRERGDNSCKRFDNRLQFFD